MKSEQFDALLPVIVATLAVKIVERQQYFLFRKLQKRPSFERTSRIKDFSKIQCF
jgi:hypothetical protein